MTRFNHTPIPYFITKGRSGAYNIIFQDNANEPVIIASHVCIEDAKFISQACNSHYKLLEALKHLTHNARKSGANMGMALEVADEAIAEAKHGANPNDRI
jgi:hypothetical protein